MDAPRADMAIVHGVDALEPGHGRLFVVIGVFDGLHRGHAYLLEQLVAGAAARGARPAVITFDHHPDEVITGTAPPLLLDPEERLERLAAAGVAVTVIQTFDVALRQTPYDAFVGRIADRVDLAGFLMTPESAFGYGRAGTPEAISALGRERGFEVEVVPPFTLDGQPVSSSAIRAAIERGDLALAERLLGRPYAVAGTVALHEAATALEFAMPVALPPPGAYRLRPATRGVAEDAEALDGAATLRGVVTPGRLVVEGLRIGFEERLAFVAVDPPGPPAAPAGPEPFGSG
jgi:riboflavin kinase/FMN adenylyltransferase